MLIGIKAQSILDHCGIENRLSMIDCRSGKIPRIGTVDCVKPKQSESISSKKWISEEFQKLKAPSLPSTSFGPVFPSDKNRYKNILPFERTRVKLDVDDDSIEDGSDYINANFISDNKYIACQAPLKSTVNDFWKMIWQQRCGLIIMVTDLFELGFEKSAKYWPDVNKLAKYGDLIVFHKSEFSINEMIVRSLLIRKASETDITSIREVVQIQYKNWPDFGVPSTTKPIRDLILLMDKFSDRAKQIYGLQGPMVVHCSAGVGRTGALIASHLAWDQIKLGQLPNVKGIVEKLRLERHPTMVKNELQYSLIYNLVNELVLLYQFIKLNCNHSNNNNNNNNIHSNNNNNNNNCKDI